MQHSRFGIWAQAIGNLAVVVGIVLIIYELNQNKELTSAQLILTNLGPGEARNTAVMGEDPRSALFKAEFCSDRLTGEEAVTLSHFYTSWVIGWFKLYQTAQLGDLDLNWRGLIRNQIKTEFTTPVSRRWLKEYIESGAAILPDEIRQVAAAALAENPVSSSDRNLYLAILAESSESSSCDRVSN